MKIIQTKNVYTGTEINVFKNTYELFVENVTIYSDIDIMRIPIHKFYTYMLIYCKRGKVIFKNKNSTETLESGFIKIIPPDTYIDFSYSPEDENEYYVINFTGKLAKEIVDCIFASEDTIFLGNRPDISDFFFEIEKSFEISKKDHIARSLLLKNMLYMMLRTQEKKSVKNIQNTIAISKTIVYIQNNFNKSITIEQLAKMCCISKNSFMILFKEHTGRSAIDYIINIRIETAKKLLKQSTYTINEISSEVGFNNPLYFSRKFKEKTGISPSEYKKQFVGK